ncbi:MAG: hypothetical protein PHC88_00235 [Terrimicrobiaceae bacterium]|nr:hypothetical protein [Terrimicrobiaceae bacterium]
MQNPPTPNGDVIVTKYASRHWAVWLQGELVAVTVYRKGAQRVAELLQTLRPTISQVVPITPPEPANAIGFQANL